jgi:hypothetical protein
VRRSSSPQRWETVASVGNINPDRVGSHWPPAPSGLMEVVASKYRGFRRTLRCLTMGPVVARPAMNGGIRYSSVRQLFHPPAEPGEIGQTPSIRAPSRFGPHCSGRSIASRQFGLDRLHLNLLAAWRTNIHGPDLVGTRDRQIAQEIRDLHPVWRTPLLAHAAKAVTSNWTGLR